MPKVDGHTVLERYHSENVPVVIFSSGSNEGEVRRALALGAREYVKKPLGFRSFVDAVRGIVDRWLHPVVGQPLSGSRDSEANEFVSLIVDGVERMSVLIHDLLEYSRTGVQKTLPTEPASAEAALNEVLFSLSAAIQESGATITNDPLPHVWLESRSLVQLFQNLIGNAIKYRGEAPLHVRVSAELKGD